MARAAAIIIPCIRTISTTTTTRRKYRDFVSFCPIMLICIGRQGRKKNKRSWSPKLYRCGAVRNRRVDFWPGLNQNGVRRVPTMILVMTVPENTRLGSCFSSLTTTTTKTTVHRPYPPRSLYCPMTMVSSTRRRKIIRNLKEAKVVKIHRITMTEQHRRWPVKVAPHRICGILVPARPKASIVGVVVAGNIIMWELHILQRLAAATTSIGLLITTILVESALEACSAWLLWASSTNRLPWYLENPFFPSLSTVNYYSQHTGTNTQYSETLPSC